MQHARARPAADATIAAVRRFQGSMPPRTAMQRFFGRSPLNPDARPWYVGALGELELARILNALPVG